MLKGILDRYRQITPKIILSETEVVYAGKTVDIVPKITEVARDLSSKGLERVVLLPSSKTGQLGEYDIPNRFVPRVNVTLYLSDKGVCSVSRSLRSWPAVMGASLFLSKCHSTILCGYCTPLVLAGRPNASCILTG